MSRNRYPVAAHLFFERDGLVLLLRRRNTGWRDGEYSVPAGHVEQGETVSEAAAREALEEVGVRLAPGDLEVVHVMHRAGDDGHGTQRPEDERVDFFLRVAAWRGEPVNAEPEKCDELRWCSLDALPQGGLGLPVIPYIAHALQCWRAGVAFSEFGWQRL